MKAIMQPLAGLAEFQEIRKSLYASPGIQLVTGCTQSQKMHFAAGLTQDSPVRLIIAENDLKAKELYEDYRLYDREVLFYPAKDLIFFRRIFRATC